MFAGDCEVVTRPEGEVELHEVIQVEAGGTRSHTLARQRDPVNVIH